MEGTAYGLEAVTGGDAGGTSGVPHGAALSAFAEALVGGDEAALAHARQRLLAALGPEGLVDAAAVAANFERMVRIADATGIPLDRPVAALTSDLRDGLGLGHFASAANSPALGWLGRRAAPVLRRALHGVLRLVGRRRPASGPPADGS